LKFRFHVKLLACLVVIVGVSGAHAGAYEEFFQAIVRDDGSAIKALLQRGMDPNTRDESGQAALYLALRAPSLNAAEALWTHPALDLNARNAAGETPLMMAALRGELAWARKLIERGAQVQQDGWCALHYAASGPEPQVLELLLNHGAKLDAVSPNRSTPLMLAAKYGPEASVDLLLRRGADPKRRNDLQLDAAEFARQAGRDALADRLAAAAR
jgi:uncharacterized protein